MTFFLFVILDTPNFNIDTDNNLNQISMSYLPWQPPSAPGIQENFAPPPPYENQWEQTHNFEDIKTEENPTFSNNESVIIENPSTSQDRISSTALNLPGDFYIKSCSKKN